MRPEREAGYVMAAALAALLSMSLVAAALVSVSVNELKRVRAAEDAARTDAALDAALVLGLREIAKDPRRRSLAFQGGHDAAAVDGVSVDLAVSWEAERLDVNAAEPEAVRDAMRAAGLGSADVDAILMRLSDARATGTVRDLDAIAPPGFAASRCAESLLTVYGGRAEPGEAAEPSDAPFARPPPGARVRLVARRDGRERRAVVIMTGDPRAPALTLDIKSERATDGEACDGA